MNPAPAAPLFPPSSVLTAPPGRAVRVGFPGAAPRGYDILVGDSILGEAGTLIQLRMGRRRCVVVTDRNVAALYLQRLEAVLAAGGHTLLPSVILPAGEGTKSFAFLETLLNNLLERGVDRQTLVVALGGGVIGDLAGLAATLAMRGLDIVQVPTTLLAQVDSSVGGKTGINTDFGKNTVGTFTQPRLVIADVTTLDSLPLRDMRAGYAEVVKYGLIQDEPFFAWCRQHGPLLLRGDRAAQVHAVSASCEHKARIVAEDEREAGLRALLNFGHTFGHALETASHYGSLLLHGEAVAIGMVMAFELSAELGFCPPEDAARVRAHLESIGLPVAPPVHDWNPDQLMGLMAQDKKAQEGRLTLILTRGIGQAFIARDLDPAPVRLLWRRALGVP